MGDLTTTGGGSGLVGLLHSTGGLTIPKPFEREIHLFDSHVAGTTHIEGIEELEPHWRSVKSSCFSVNRRTPMTRRRS